MSDLSDLIVDMIVAGVDPALVGRVAAVCAAREAVIVPDEQAQRRREKDRERSRVRRNPQTSAESADNPSPLSSPPLPSPGPPSETPPIIPPSSDIYRATERDFALFWSVYPSKVGKDDARKAFARAVSRIAGPDPPAVMIAAVELAKSSQRWIDGFVPNPATWLNQGRWQDDIIPAVERKAKGDSESFSERDARHRRENLERSFAASERVVDLARRRRGEISDSEPTDAFG